MTPKEKTMQGIYETVVTAIKQAMATNVEKIIGFLPNLISAFLILIIGWILAKIAEQVISRILKTLTVDSNAEKKGISKMLADVGINRPPSALIGRSVYWVVLILFLLPSLETLRLSYVSEMVARFIDYLPNLFAAALIFVIGLTVARFISATVTASAKAAGLEYANGAGLFIKYFLTLIILILGLAQLGIQTGVLTIIFTVLVVSLGLAIALSLGLGSRNVVSNILAGAFAKEHFPVGKDVVVQGMNGTVKEIGAVTTSIESEGRDITIPNTLLIENVFE